jgi:hypothetical protein
MSTKFLAAVVRTIVLKRGVNYSYFYAGEVDVWEKVGELTWYSLLLDRPVEKEGQLGHGRGREHLHPILYIFFLI